MQFKMQFCSKQQLHQTMALWHLEKTTLKESHQFLATWISRICLFYTSVSTLRVGYLLGQHTLWMPKQYADAARPSHRPEQLNHRVDGSEIRRSPVDMVNIPHVFPGYSYTSQVMQDFWTINCSWFIAENRKTSSLEEWMRMSSCFIWMGFWWIFPDQIDSSECGIPHKCEDVGIP